MPISNTMAKAINAQVGREFGAHFQYLEIASHFHDDGLPQMGAFFDQQAAEEHEHAMRFLQYVRDSGAKVAIPAIPAPKAAYKSSKEAVALALKWEQEVTAHINDLVDLAIKENDHATRVMLNWFVTEQVEELDTMGELLQIVERAGEPNMLLVEEHVRRKAAAEFGAGN
ncbi:MAG: ferritin [Thermoleophilia bacterium]|nr:ferritin [Thermoleophilia bacterium]